MPDTLFSTIEITGRSAGLSFDEAFADACSQIPDCDVVDARTRVKVLEIGGNFGGFAGVRELYVRIQALIDQSGDRLIEFLTELAIDPVRVDALLKDPDGVMQAAGLSESDIELIKSRDAARIRKELEARGVADAGLGMSLGLLNVR